MKPYKIQVDIGERQDYKTLEEAEENKWGVSPSPLALAQIIKNGETLKAIRITLTRNNQYKYKLVEGGMRYWAHVLAYGENMPIQALVQEGLL